MPPHRAKRSACHACRQQKKRCSGVWPCTLCQRLKKQCELPSDTPGENIPPYESSSATENRPTYSPSCPSGAHLPIVSWDSSERTSRNAGNSIHITAKKKSKRYCGSTSRNGQTSLDGQPGPQSSPHYSQDLCGIDFTGNILEPASPYSWLHQARLRLGTGVTRLTQESFSSDAAATSIFSYGDAVPLLQAPADLPLAKVEDMPWDLISNLVDIYFERAMVTYHFLHLPTVRAWLEKLFTSQGTDLAPQQRCIAILVLSHGASYLTLEELTHINNETDITISSENLFRLALNHLEHEKGRPNMESVQARLIQVHHLLSTSRPNQAWYAFGTVVQLVWALGLHRASDIEEKSLLQQLRSRTFWSVYATDKYISIAMGRPLLVHDDLLSQRLPLPIDDDDLASKNITENGGKDCTLSATLYHILLSKIVAKGISEQRETDKNTLVETVLRNRQKLDTWKKTLPPLLSGQVHPSSLIPKFRRQAVVLRIFYLNAVILINRPLLLSHRSGGIHGNAIQESAESCLSASKDLSRQLLQFDKEGQPAAPYWFTQNITFNAISILYIHLLRNLQSHGGYTSSDTETLSLAEEAHSSLQANSEDNAPNFRYCLVLDELRKEIRLSEESIARRTAHAPAGASYPEPIPSSMENVEDVGSMLESGLDMAALLPHGSDDLDSSFWNWFDDLSTYL